METPDDGLDYGYGRTWFTTEQQYVIFDVKACKDAHIMLTAVPGDYKAEDSYEIVLGGNQNTELYVRRGYGVISILILDEYRYISVLVRSKWYWKNVPSTQLFIFIIFAFRL